ncbi:MAG TPA: thioredoxin family protein [Campylobacteraceae bacterium]|jgi:thioredoxin-related protein|nr:thioredoxin family protein [Campylobacteraceae bacterium]HHD83621.1 thioredoxin family protein [Campylobacteraceae bacterium]
MKKILSMLSIVTFLYAGALDWEHNYEKALQIAQSKSKPLLMMYHARWCPECAYMKEVIFKDPKLSEYMQSHYILVDMNLSKEKPPKGFSYKGVPTFFIISPEGKLTGKIEGAASAHDFLERLKTIR